VAGGVAQSVDLSSIPSTVKIKKGRKEIKKAADVVPRPGLQVWKPRHQPGLAK
jgi:hypothetical protein